MLKLWKKCKGTLRDAYRKIIFDPVCDYAGNVDLIKCY